MIDTALLQDLTALLGPDGVVTQGRELERLSRDYHWFSPLLSEDLAGRVADAAVAPHTVESLRRVLALAARRGIPVTVRGGGTGNHGQSVPLRGGLLLDALRLDRVLEVGDGWVRTQPGVRLAALEAQVRTRGWELRLYPSTWQTATVGGFVAGGFAGIGAVRWGTLWDGMVRGATLLTMEPEPRTVRLAGDELLSVINTYGTTGVITELELALAPAEAWSQHVATFQTLERAVACARELGHKPGALRLLSVFEWPVPGTFTPLLRAGGVTPGRASVHVMLGPGRKTWLARRAARHGGEIIWSTAKTSDLPLSDFAFNHTTLWAKKADPSWTYLLCTFDPQDVTAQIAQLKAWHGDDLLIHLEYIRSGRWSRRFGTADEVLPQAMPLVRYRSRAQLRDVVGSFEALGVHVADPHTYRLDSGPRWNGATVLAAKRERDPANLLNPGKISSL